ncbi:MAG TPA: hypothetical protein VMU27_03550, partial [Candidatus Paceibacterota bacterium]|nr:hypothetical protein [Candidatus Paceibacterota bacterium]
PSILATCTSPNSTKETVASSTVSLGGAQFAEFTSTGVAAGNTYDIKAYRSNVSGTCFEITEMLHSGNIANYPKGSVTPYDQAQYFAILDAMAQSFSPSAATTTP